MTNAEARFSNSLRPRKPEGSLGRTAQDVHLDSHTVPELSPALKPRFPKVYLRAVKIRACALASVLVWAKGRGFEGH